jgi:pantothenate kinase type III
VPSAAAISSAPTATSKNLFINITSLVGVSAAYYNEKSVSEHIPAAPLHGMALGADRWAQNIKAALISSEG